MTEDITAAVHHAITALVYVVVFTHFRAAARDLVRESGRAGKTAFEALGVVLILAVIGAPLVGALIAGDQANSEAFREEDYYWAGFVALALVLLTAVGLGVVEGRRRAVVRVDGFRVTFQDSRRRRWSVGEVFSDDESYQSLYLLFCSGTDVRRLAPCPLGWSMLTAEGLEYLLDRATPENADAEIEARAP